MQYFNNLPVININDSQFRNLFKRVVINEIREDQLRNYRIQDYETLPSIANKVYGSPDYWWIIALLNNISDINFDISLPTEQIEFIATELATEKYYANSILQASIIQLTPEMLEMDIVFNNTEADDYVVILSLQANNTTLGDLTNVEYGYQKIGVNSFRIVVEDTLSTPINIGYAVFKQTDPIEELNMELFVEYFDKLLREADDKRIIRLIKEQDVGYFITKFLLALNNDVSENGNVETFKSTINNLKQYKDKDDPEHGLIVDFDSGLTAGVGDFSEIIIDNYDYDYHIYLSNRPTADQLGTLGDIGIRSNLIKPRVYNTGASDIVFDYLVVSPDDKKFSEQEEIIQSGISNFAGTGLYTEIALDDNDDILNEAQIGVMITPIIDRLVDFTEVGKVSFEAIDKNTLRIYNTGASGNRFYWSIFKNTFSNITYLFPGTGNLIALYVGYVTTDETKICPVISPPLFSTWPTAGNIGEVGFAVDSLTEINVFNSGASGDSFNYRVYVDEEHGDILTDPVEGVPISVENDPSIIDSTDICFAATQLATSSDDLGNAGTTSIQLIDKNNIKFFNSGDDSIPFRYVIIHDAIEHGIAETAGLNSYTTITLQVHGEIVNTTQMNLLITPIFSLDPEVENIGDIYYLPISTTEVRVYNTGIAGLTFKWILVERQ